MEGCMGLHGGLHGAAWLVSPCYITTQTPTSMWMATLFEPYKGVQQTIAQHRSSNVGGMRRRGIEGDKGVAQRGGPSGCTRLDMGHGRSI